MRFGHGYGAWAGGFGGDGFADFGPGGGRGRHGGRLGGGRGRRRMFDGGELRLLLLGLIGDAPRHGYDLIREVEERTGGSYAPSPGVIYPTLSLLDEMGLIQERKSEGAKKQFAITDEGKAYLEEHAGAVEALLARLDAVASMRERTDGGPVRRAMMNVKMALRHRLADEADADTLHRVAAILDEAAQKIERL